jgi:hypothetical protein
VLYQETTSALARLDQHDELKVPQAAVVRQAVRAMRQWQLQRPRSMPAPQAVRGAVLPWWAYPLASAAIIVLALLAWWGNRPHDPLTPPGPGPVIAHDVTPRAAAYAEQLAASFEPSENTQLLVDAQDQLADLDATYGPW